jgi:hypothetical protein
MVSPLTKIATLLVFLAAKTFAVDNGLAITPQMGWVSFSFEKGLLYSL